MARTKADIEKDWTKAETLLEAAIAKTARPANFEAFDAALEKLTKAWELWHKYLAEADKKISEKDWKDDKKLDADRKKFKAWVITRRDKDTPKYEKQIFAAQKEFAVWVGENKTAEKTLKAIKVKIFKALSDFKADRDAPVAIAALEELTEEIGKVQSNNNLKESVFNEGRTLNKAIASAMPALEKAEKLQLRVEGDVNKMTYDDVRKNMKLFKAYCQMAKQPEHARFFEATNYGKNGSEDAYRKFIKTNSVNVPSSLVAEFDVVSNDPRPDWSKAPWEEVVKHIDTMLGKDTRHIIAFRQKLIEARSA